MDCRRIKVMVDTNVLLDYLLPSRKDHECALALFELILAVKIEAAISTQSILDAFYVCRKEKVDREKEVRSTLHTLLHKTNAGYIDTGAASQALLNEHPDVEDSAQIEFAYAECCDVILSRDKALLARGLPHPLRSMTPEEFLLLCKDTSQANLPS